MFPALFCKLLIYNIALLVLKGKVFQNSSLTYE